MAYKVKSNLEIFLEYQEKRNATNMSSSKEDSLKSADGSILLFKYDLNIIKVGYQTSKDGKTVEVTQVTSDWSFKNVSCLTNSKVKDSLIKAYFLEVLIHEYGNKLEESMTIAVAIEDFENFCHSKRSDIYGNPGFLDNNQKQHVDSMLSLPVKSLVPQNSNLDWSGRPLARPTTYKDEIEFAPISASGFELQVKPPAEFYLAKDAEQQELRIPKTLPEMIIHLHNEGLLKILLIPATAIMVIGVILSLWT